MSVSSYVVIPGVLVYGALILALVGPHSVVDVPPLVWWTVLSSVTVLLFLLAFFSSSKDPHVRNCALVVCACYCHRAVWMHCTVERDCFWGYEFMGFNPCCSFWGRTVACTGELTFVYLSTRQLTNKNVNKLVVGLIAIAQTISFIGVAKKHYGWFFWENFIWTVCAVGVGLHVSLYQSRNCYNSVPFLLFCFFCYNVFEDLPMYLRRHSEHTHLEGYNLGVLEGALDALSCDLVSQSFSVWRPQMLWQSMNYTVVPAACLGLMACAEAENGVESVNNNKKIK